MKMNLSHSQATGQTLRRLPESTTIVKIVGAAVTGVVSFVAAVLTTVVESGGFWQYFWLGACILFFVCAMSLVILASRDGLRIDHAGLSFEPHGTSSAGQQGVGIGEDRAT
jgi:hypothetical protein